VTELSDRIRRSFGVRFGSAGSVCSLRCEHRSRELYVRIERNETEALDALETRSSRRSADESVSTQRRLRLHHRAKLREITADSACARGGLIAVRNVSRNRSILITARFRRPL